MRLQWRPAQLHMDQWLLWTVIQIWNHLWPTTGQSKVEFFPGIPVLNMWVIHMLWWCMWFCDESRLMYLKISIEFLPHFWGQYPSSDLFLADCLLCHWSVCLQGIVVQATLVENWKAFTREICLHKQDTECTQPMLHFVHLLIERWVWITWPYQHKIRLLWRLLDYCWQ